MKTRKEATKALSEIPCINFGGCLISAYAFYLHEQKAGRAKNLQLVALSYSEDSYYETNLAFLKGESQKATSSCHFGWTYNKGKVVYDCDGKVDRYSIKLLIDKAKTDQFCKASLNDKDWNRRFDRKNSMPLVEKELGVELKGIELNPYRR